MAEYTPRRTTLSTKQIQILVEVQKGSVNDLGEAAPIDLDQLLERLPYKTTKESMQFSIRALIRRGMLEKAGNESRRGRSRVLYRLTDYGVKTITGEPVDVQYRNDSVKNVRVGTTSASVGEQDSGHPQGISLEKELEELFEVGNSVEKSMGYEEGEKPLLPLGSLEEFLEE